MLMHTFFPSTLHTMHAATHRTLVALVLWVWLTFVDDEFEIESLLPLSTAFVAWSEVLLSGNRKRLTAAAPRSFWSFRDNTEGHSSGIWERDVLGRAAQLQQEACDMELAAENGDPASAEYRLALAARMRRWVWSGRCSTSQSQTCTCLCTARLLLLRLQAAERCDSLSLSLATTEGLIFEGSSVSVSDVVIVCRASQSTAIALGGRLGAQNRSKADRRSRPRTDLRADFCRSQSDAHFCVCCAPAHYRWDVPSQPIAGWIPPLAQITPPQLRPCQQQTAPSELRHSRQATLADAGAGAGAAGPLARQLAQACQ